MKKLFAIVLVAVLCLSVTACGLISVESYVEANRDQLIETVESSISSSGVDCTADVKAEGNNIIFNVNIKGFNDIPQETKDMLQETYDGMQSTFDASFEQMQEGIPSLESTTWNICEEDGDVMAVVKAGVK